MDTSDNTNNQHYNLLDEHVRGGVERYIEYGIPPGHFLTAVIENDLQGAFMHADRVNRGNLGHIVQWFYDFAPFNCWGSKQRFSDWINRGGLNGV